MKLLKTSLLNSYAVALKMFCMLGINKLLAIYIGPSGYALIGQLQSFIQSMTQVATAGILNGVVRFTSEYNGDVKQQRDVWRAGVALSCFISLFLSLVIYFNSKKISIILLSSESYENIFHIFSFSLLFYSLNSILMSILNGKREVVSYVKASISGSLLSLIVIASLVHYFELFGALVALVIYQAVSFLVTIYISIKFKWFRIESFFGNFDKLKVRKLLSYSMMALVSAIFVPLSHLLIRNNLIESFGQTEAGYWEAVWRLSSSYMMFVTGVLTFYFLPRLAEIKNTSEMKVELKNGYKLLVPFMIVSSLSIFLLKDFIFYILFSEDFVPALSLLPYQLVGDFFRASGFLLGYVMLAKGMVRLFVISEMLFSGMFVLLTYLLTQLLSLEGVTIAYLINLILYNLFLYFFIWYKYLGKNDAI